MPWAERLSLGDNNLFFGPKHNIYTFFMILLVYLIWYYYLSVKFVMWIVKQKIENKRNLFKKTIFYWSTIDFSGIWIVGVEGLYDDH